MKGTLKVYRQAVILFVTIIVLVFTTNIFFYWYNLKHVEENMKHQIEQSTDFAIQQLELQISYVNQYCREILNRPELKVISYSDPYVRPWEYYAEINDLRYKLNSIKVANHFINDSMLFIRNKDMVLSADSGIIHLEDSDYQNLFESELEVSRLDFKLINDKIYLFDFDPLYERSQALNQLDTVLCIEFEPEYFLSYISNYLNQNLVSISFLNDENILASKLFGKEKENGIKKKNIQLITKQLEPTNQIFVFEFELEVYGYNFIFLSVLIGVCFIFAGIGIIYYVTCMNKLMHKPIKKIIKAFKNVEAGCYNVELTGHETEEFTYLYEAIGKMIARLDTSIKAQYEQKLALQQSEIKQYQLQINPHFLYNGFYNIQRMCTNQQYEKAILLSKRLASYYRYITRNGIYFVSIKEEIKHMEDYIDIQTIRFQDRIKINRLYTLQDLEDIKVPRLIFQPLLENIYEHAFQNLEDQGNIDIFLCLDEEWLKCSIEDSGTGMEDEQIDVLNSQLEADSGYVECTGILNVNKRLKLHYGKQSGLVYKKGEHGQGIRIEMKIDLKMKLLGGEE